VIRVLITIFLAYTPYFLYASDTSAKVLGNVFAVIFIVTVFGLIKFLIDYVKNKIKKNNAVEYLKAGKG